MMPAVLQISASKLLFKISLITGWEVYEDQELQNVLREQFEFKLVESFANCNCDEVEYAFRNNTGVKDWGKYINLSMIDEVMIPYLQKRKELSNIEFENSEKQPAPQIDTEQMPDEEFLLTVKNTYHFTKKWQLISVMAYDILVKQGKINLSNQEKEVIKEKARVNFFSLDNKENTLGLRHNEQERFIIQDAKKIAVAEYFNNQNIIL